MRKIIKKYQQYYISIKNNDLITDTFIYGISNIGSALIPFLLIPFLTKNLSPENFGIFTNYNVLLSVIVLFVGLNMHGAIQQQYFKLNHDNFTSYLSNAFIISIISSIFVCLIIILSGSFIFGFTGIPISWVLISVPIGFFNFATIVLLSLFQIKSKPLNYLLYKLFNAIMNFILTILIVTYYDQTWQGPVLGKIIAYTATFLIGAYILIFIFKINLVIYKKYITHLLKFSMPLVISALGGMILTVSDRFFITNMISLNENGIYSLGYQLGMIVSLITIAANQALMPKIYEDLSNKIRDNRNIHKIINYYFLIIIVSMIFINFFVYFFFDYFIGTEYSQSKKYIWIISLGYGAQGIYFIFVNFLFFIEKTGIIAIMTFSTAILNLALNFIFIKYFGGLGAAISTLICFLTQGILIFLFTNRHFKLYKL